jgi:hypothetical protein
MKEQVTGDRQEGGSVVHAIQPAFHVTTLGTKHRVSNAYCTLSRHPSLVTRHFPFFPCHPSPVTHTLYSSP